MKYYLDIEIIISTVCKYFNTTPEIIFSRNRKREIREKRQIFFYLAYYNTGLTIEKIGKDHGNYDHCTVLHARKTIENLMDSEKSLKYKITEIQSILDDFKEIENESASKLETLKNIIKKRVNYCFSIAELNSTLANFINQNNNQLT